ncbi:hypothetical protein ACVWW5_007834 [Bradyrhizobium sp. LM3.4]
MSAFAKPLKIALGLLVIAALIVIPMNFNRYGLFILSQWAVMAIAAMGRSTSRSAMPARSRWRRAPSSASALTRQRS